MPEEWRDKADRLQTTLLPYLPEGKSLRLCLTDNRYSMVAVHRARDGYSVRLHRMFADLSPGMMHTLARYVVRSDSHACRLLNDYIDRNKHSIREQPRQLRKIRLRTRGGCYDLQDIFKQLNSQHFAGRHTAGITWGPRLTRRGRQRSIKMGSYSVQDRLIRIHPRLDAPWVPPYFVSWIVFHEMLHGMHDVVRVGKRRCFHSKDFLAEEKTFPDYQQASAWEKRNMARLLGG
jgi:hypothetical protein